MDYENSESYERLLAVQHQSLSISSAVSKPHIRKVLMLTVLPAWNTPANLTRWWQAAGSGVGAKITHTWTSDRVGWEDLEWEAMPLTPDKQLRQKVDKILEIVDFKFEDNLTDAEKTAFGRCVYDLTK